MGRALFVLREGEVRPGPPAGGVPAQRLPAGARRALQVLVLPFVLVDVAAQRLLQRVVRPRFGLAGACARTGQCCRYITQRTYDGPRITGRAVSRLFRWWATEVNGFYLRGFDVDDGEGDGHLVYSCRHLTAAGTCDSYTLRPALCRTWPRVTFYGEPHLYRGCGYQVVRREASKGRTARTD